MIENDTWLVMVSSLYCFRWKLIRSFCTDLWVLWEVHCNGFIWHFLLQMKSPKLTSNFGNYRVLLGDRIRKHRIISNWIGLNDSLLERVISIHHSQKVSKNWKKKEFVEIFPRTLFFFQFGWKNTVHMHRVSRW